MLNLQTVRTAALVTLGVALWFLAYGVASAPTRAAVRLGMRGMKRTRALRDSAGWALVEPVVRWLGVRVSGVLGPRLAKRLDRQIELAGDYLGLTPEEYVGLSVVSCALGTITGVGFGQFAGHAQVSMILCGALGAALPYLQISGEAQRRLKSITRGLPNAIDLMTLGMSAGLDFNGAVAQVVDKATVKDDPLVEEMSRILRELRLGNTRRQALLDFARRAPSPSVQELVGALVQAEERGNPVADVLQIQAVVSRQHRTVRAEEAAAKAGVKLVGPLFLLFICIMLLVIGPMVLSLASQDL